MYINPINNRKAGRIMQMILYTGVLVEMTESSVELQGDGHGSIL